MIVHLIDGTYELFRHFYGIRRAKKPDPPLGAVAGVLGTVVQMLETGATHVGVATDHVIESFRNDLWPGYKTGAGIEPAEAMSMFAAPSGELADISADLFIAQPGARPRRAQYSSSLDVRDIMEPRGGGRAGAVGGL